MFFIQKLKCPHIVITTNCITRTFEPQTLKDQKRIAILGGGPSGLFMYKRFVDSGRTDLDITIFEKKKRLGIGMPYSPEGANEEHITNVSGNEIPDLVTPISEWIKTVHQDTLRKFRIDSDKFNDYKVLPRLLFGEYLSAQFKLLQQTAHKTGIHTHVFLNTEVTDIIDHPEKETVTVEVAGGDLIPFDQVIICTGHRWPMKHEGVIPGYFDSPYPPSKLAFKVKHPVAIKGSSLTAIDAIRTLSRHNGKFLRESTGKLSYQLDEDSEGFKLVMHSRNGMLPAIRFHLEDPHLLKDSVMKPAEVHKKRAANNGFLSIDEVFEKNFKELFIEKDPEFYQEIKAMYLEEFVDKMMELREKLPPFQLFKAEYIEAEKSIRRKESVYWKELLAVLSFTMNYPAKYFSAEDMQRLQKVLMPLISIVIAFIPQSSVEEMMALHEAGLLDLLAVGDDSDVEPKAEGGAVYHYVDEAQIARSVDYETYIDCVGQPHLSYTDLPYASLIKNRTVSPAQLKFSSAEKGAEEMNKSPDKVIFDQEGNYYLKVPGITINDSFQVVDSFGALNERIYMMAVPYIGGYNPDYSGLDFCEAASGAIIKSIR